MRTKVLIVDDDATMRSLLNMQLRAAGYEVLSAASAVEALRILRSERMGVVVSDWTMPEMSGLDLCRAVRADESIASTYILILTAGVHQGCAAEAFEAGANAFLIKPWNRLELIAQVESGLELSEWTSHALPCPPDLLVHE